MYGFEVDLLDFALPLGFDPVITASGASIIFEADFGVVERKTGGHWGQAIATGEELLKRGVAVDGLGAAFEEGLGFFKLFLRNDGRLGVVE